LPTIRSRAQIVQFRPLSTSDLQQLLLAEQIASDEAAASRLAGVSSGRVARARELADPELWQFRDALLERIARPGWDVLSAEKAVLDFVQDAGTEASLRRDRLRTIIGFVLDFHRDQLAQQAESNHLLPALDACLAAVEQVDRNANQTLVVSHWLSQLAGRDRPLVAART
jgi:DNA polymerase-3 subunit delta'